MRAAILLLTRRLVSAVPTMLAIVALSFFLMRLTPGGPFDRDRAVPPEIKANLERAYHLDETLPRQFLRYLGDLAHGDFGPSFTYKDFTVTELIEGGFPVSAALGATAMALALITGLGLGTAAALRRETLTDHAIMVASQLGLMVPSFVMAPLLSLVFGVYLRLLPAGGWGSSGSITYAVLPVVSLALPPIAAIARLFRNSLIETLQLPFIRTARAKGLPERIVVLRHALPGAILPVVSYLGPAIAGIVTGSVVVEQVFSIPGIGRYFVLAAINRDYTLVTGALILYGALILLLNLAVDLLYGVLDPRVAAP